MERHEERSDAAAGRERLPRHFSSFASFAFGGENVFKGFHSGNSSFIVFVGCTVDTNSDLPRVGRGEMSPQQQQDPVRQSCSSSYLRKRSVFALRTPRAFHPAVRYPKRKQKQRSLQESSLSQERSIILLISHFFVSGNALFGLPPPLVYTYSRTEKTCIGCYKNNSVTNSARS